MGIPGTTEWYAFKDPKTGREYYNEPSSGRSTWVLPTSFRSNNGVDSAENTNKTRSSMNASKTGNKAKFKKSQRSQIGRWNTYVMWTLSILVLNTAFLLALVRLGSEKGRQLTTKTNLTNVNSPGETPDKMLNVNSPGETPDEINIGDHVGFDETMQMEVPDIQAASNHERFSANALRDDLNVVGGSSANEEPSCKSNKLVKEETNGGNEGSSNSTASPSMTGDSYSQHSLQLHEISGEGLGNMKSQSKDKRKNVGVDSMREPKRMWAAVLVKRTRQVRVFFARFFGCVWRVGRRLAGGREKVGMS